MYVISFRIPFNVLGTTQYVNGAGFSTRAHKPGKFVHVMNDDVSGIVAEVIDSRPTKRTDFPWTLVNYEVEFPA